MQVDLKSSTSPVMNETDGREPTRRQFLEMAVAGGAIALMGKMELNDPHTVFAQSKLSPSAALAALMEGNGRFVSGRGTAHQHDLAVIKQHTASKQEPFAGVLSCSDSRVPVELVFDQSIGHIFVGRVAGNIVTPEIMGSLEYGALVLGTPVILVLGHGGCGAVKAAVEGKAVPGEISSLFPHIQPAIDQTGHDVEAGIRANAKLQAKLLQESSPVLSGLIHEGKLKVAAGYYELATGKVTLLN